MITVERLEQEKRELEKQLEQAIATANAIRGAIQLVEKLIGGERGNSTNRTEA